MGIQRGDVLLLWECGDSKLHFESPVDFYRTQGHMVTCAGPSQVEGLRGSEHHTWALGRGDWGISVQPNFIDSLQSKYDEGLSLFTKHMYPSALDCWHELANQAPPSWLQPWLSLRAAEFFAEARVWQRADVNYQKAADLASEARGGGSLVLAEILYAWGEAFWQRSDWEQAERRYRKALAEVERYGDVQQIGKMLNCLGSVALNQGDLDDADQYFRRNVAITESFGPSLNLAANFAELGTVAMYRGDLAAAEEYYRRDLAMTTKLAPRSSDLAVTYNNFGMLLERRRDLVRAEQYLRKALLIALLVDPNGKSPGMALRKALLIALLVDPNGKSPGMVLGNLGSIMRDSGQLVR